MNTFFKPFWQPNKAIIAHFLQFCAIFALTFGACHQMTSCSSVEKDLRRAEAAWAIGEYQEAASQYKRAYSHTPASDKEKRGQIAFLMGESYRRYGNAARAVGAYRSAERYNFTDTTTLLRKGQMMLLQGEYKQAKTAFEDYLQLLEERDTFTSPDPRLTALKVQALRGLESAEESPEMKKRGSAYTVKIASQFNSNRSDFCPALLGELEDKDVQLFFTSNRNSATGNELSGITGLKPCDIYVVKKDEKGKWKAVEQIEGGLNTEYDEGAPSFSPDGKTMYLTVCTTNPEYPRMAEIYSCARSDASWGKPSAIKITGDTLSSYAHPAVSPDGQWLYFTSDMPGGYGGTDIWRAQFSGGKVGFVENLGPDINSDGNECFPAFRPTGELYYSSDGLGGMGGLDLYHATQDSTTHRWTVKALPAPMNSNGDDFGITFDGLHNRGYFSSSRSTGGRGWDKLYEFSHPEVLTTVKGWVYEQDGYELPEAQVYMVGSDGTNQKLVLKTDGTFEQPVTPGVDYLFLATCKGYLNVADNLHADSLDYEYTYELDFPLPSLSIPVLVRNVFYAFGSAEITDDSSVALDRLASLLIDNPNITIELASHCDYRGNDDFNMKLSQRRAESVTKYLSEHGVDSLRLSPKGYGESVPKVVTGKLVEAYPFLTKGDTLTEAYITQRDSTGALRFSVEEQEVMNALNRRTEFRVMRTTYGLFDEEGNLRIDAAVPTKPLDTSDFEDEALPTVGNMTAKEVDVAAVDEAPSRSVKDEIDDDVPYEDSSSTSDSNDDEVFEEVTTTASNDDDEVFEEVTTVGSNEDDEAIEDSSATSSTTESDDEFEYEE